MNPEPATPPAGLSVAASKALTCDVPPILVVHDYASAYGYSVTARFDFTDVPPEHHEILLQLIRLGGYHLAQPVNAPPKAAPVKQRWWRRILPGIKNSEKTDK